MPAASVAPQQLHQHDHPVSALRVTETHRPRAPVGAGADKRDIGSPQVAPGEPGSSRELGWQSGLETLSNSRGD